MTEVTVETGKIASVTHRVVWEKVRNDGGKVGKMN